MVTSPDQEVRNRALVDEIKRGLATTAVVLNVTAPSVADNKGHAYEAWLYFELAASLAAYTPQGYDHAGDKLANGANFYVRGGPGYIRPKTSKARAEPCHFTFVFKARRFEIHVGVKQVGASGLCKIADERRMTHEADISILPAPYVEAVRQQDQGGPYPGPRIAMLELKAFDAESELSHGIPRALIGVAVDLDTGFPTRNLIIDGRGSRQWLELGSSMVLGLVTTASIPANAKRYLEHYEAIVADGVEPSWQPPAFIDELKTKIYQPLVNMTERFDQAEHQARLALLTEVVRDESGR